MSFLVLPNIPGSSQDRRRVPEDAKEEAPSMPNDTDMFANMPRIRHPEASEPAHISAEEFNETCAWTLNNVF